MRVSSYYFNKLLGWVIFLGSDFRVFGRITESWSQAGMAGLIVEAYDKDSVNDDLLGSVTTGITGNFEITFEKSDFKERYGDDNPDIYLRVKTPSGTTIYSSEENVRYRANEEEEFIIAIEESTLKSRKHTLNTNLDLSNVKDADTTRSIKVAAVRDGKILESKVIKLSEVENISSIPIEIEYFTGEREKPLGVNLVAGPDVPEKDFLAASNYSRWISPKAGWKDFTNKVPNVVIPDTIFKWLWCHTYTIRGKVVCPDGNPVPGATVVAKDVDCFWWWCREDTVGTATTNPDGTFEMTFKWCCRYPYWILRLRDWRINPDLLDKITHLAEIPPIGIPPLPDPAPDLRIFGDIINLHRSVNLSEDLNRTTGIREMKNISAVQPGNLETMRTELLQILPANPELSALRIWPWWPWKDCRPDIIFEVRQDCKQPDTVIYKENYFNTRWNIPTLLEGVTLIANEDACCIPVVDPPEGNCFKFSEVGCTSLMNIGGNDPMSPVVTDLEGFAYPDNLDRPFGETLSIKGIFGDLADVDYYRIAFSTDGITYNEMLPDMVNSYSRVFWGPPLAGGPAQWNTVLFKKQEIDGHWVFETREKFERDNDPASWGITRFWTSNKYLVVSWNTDKMASDGLYYLKLVAYDEGPGDTLVNERVMPQCGSETSTSPIPETLLICIDNRIMGVHPPSVPSHPWGSGFIHLGTVEPDCDILKVIKNPGQADEKEVKPCSILRLKAADDMRICFNASDVDGHLQAYHLSLHWGESSYKVLINGFNGASLGTIQCVNNACGTVDPCVKGHEKGPRYQDAVAQGADRPIWYGGNYRIGLKGSDFPTCCAYQLKLRTWKRTFRGCDDPYNFHWNVTEYSFTVIREDLIGNPLFKECQEICPDSLKKEKAAKMLTDVIQ